MSNQRVPGPGAPAARPRLSRHGSSVVALAIVVAALIAACGSAVGPSPAGTPEPTLRPTGTPAGSPPISHSPEARAVVLRLDEGGGFVPPSYLAVQVPYFSLYGDGTVIYRPAAEPLLEGDLIGPLRSPALHVARMTEAQVQDLLRDALVDGGLAAAEATYENPMVADASTATFTVHAGGLDKTVSVYALGLEAGAGPDAAIRAQLAALGERLRAFDREVADGRATETGRYAPDRFRATLIEAGGAPAQAPRAWPWPTFGPDAFRTAEGSGYGFPTRTITGMEAGLVGVDEIAGGTSGIWVAAPDGATVYELVLRPVLPDESG